MIVYPKNWNQGSNIAVTNRGCCFSEQDTLVESFYTVVNNPLLFGYPVLQKRM